MIDTLRDQLNFIIEIDKLKQVSRQTLLTDCSRHENSAEHSWHLAVMALVLSGYAEKEEMDLLRVLTMVLIHDIVEIDAGDTYCYDENAKKSQKDREISAADRIFGLLPSDQREKFVQIWHEFEARNTPEARFAAALDRLQPVMHNYLTGGIMWRRYDVKKDQVKERNRTIGEGAPDLWQFAESLIDEAVERGMLAP
ncbi:MAG: HD domain-containing protein [Syntrophales bacterium]|jgi:putative hydrolase of HD superfamily|nr:HD domain-containing protein [Syntrophales bacterium]MDY0043308.1 HD domain-containing protein [Syntrophales bacterium]